MNHCPSDILQKLLVDLGIGVLRSANPSDDWAVYSTQIADSPDKAICVYDTEAQLDGREMIGGEVLDHKGFQVAVRAPHYEDGFVKAEEIRVAFDQTVYDETVTLGSHTYSVHSITRKGGVLKLGRDLSSSERQLFTLNGIASIKQLT